MRAHHFWTSSKLRFFISFTAASCFCAQSSQILSLPPRTLESSTACLKQSTGFRSLQRAHNRCPAIRGPCRHVRQQRPVVPSASSQALDVNSRCTFALPHFSQRFLSQSMHNPDPASSFHWRAAYMVLTLLRRHCLQRFGKQSSHRRVAAGSCHSSSTN